MYLIEGSSRENNRVLIKSFLRFIASSKNLNQGLIEFSSQINLVEEIKDENLSREVSAILYYKNMQSRFLVSKIPKDWYEDQFYFSVIALLCTSLKYLDSNDQNLLFKCLKLMSLKYNSTQENTSIKDSNNIPNQAFLLASISD